jgi:protein ImuA
MISLTSGREELTRMLLTRRSASRRHNSFRTGLSLWDAMAPGSAFEYGRVHELLCEPCHPMPHSIALFLAKAAQGKQAGGAIVWSDLTRELYPPALSAAGVDLRQLILLRCRNREETLWALSECLGSPGVSATVASIQRLSRVEARRLQLAAERGGGIGIFHRPWVSANNGIYAATTRWWVKPAAGEDGVQRWSIELMHGHGGQVGQSVLLEVDRETHVMRALAPMADRPAASSPQRVTA